jgi:hypothetical protein
MKKNIFAFIVAIFSLNVNAQRQKLYIPKMDKKLLKSDSVRDWMRKNCPGKYFYSECYDTINKRQYILKDSILTITESFNKKQDQHSFQYKLTYKYYPNNQLQFVTITMNTSGMSGDLFLGTWYYYRDNGKVFQKVDNEKPFKNDYFDLLKKAKELKIENPIISRNFGREASFWFIESLSKGQYSYIKRTIILKDKNLEIVFDKSTNEKDYWDRSLYNFDEYRYELYDYFWGRKKLEN